MSIPVELTALRDTIAAHTRPPYLLTVGDDGRAHSVAVDCTWRGDELEMPAGNRTVANAGARPLVSLLWPPDDVGGYSLIVDAEVTHTEGSGSGANLVRVRPTRGVLHRPAASAADATELEAATGCGSDCVPLLDRS